MDSSELPANPRHRSAARAIRASVGRPPDGQVDLPAGALAGQRIPGSSGLRCPLFARRTPQLLEHRAGLRRQREDRADVLRDPPGHTYRISAPAVSQERGSPEHLGGAEILSLRCRRRRAALRLDRLQTVGGAGVLGGLQGLVPAFAAQRPVESLGYGPVRPQRQVERRAVSRFAYTLRKSICDSSSRGRRRRRLRRRRPGSRCIPTPRS